MIEQFDIDLKTAMLARDMVRIDVMKLIKSALVNKRIELGKDLSDADIQQVLRTEAKKRTEAIDLYRQGGNTAAADKESQEKTIIEAYLPQQMDDTELLALVASVKSDLGPEANAGALIQETLKRAAGRADGKRVAQLIQMGNG